jgi:hypothetical protein
MPFFVLSIPFFAQAQEAGCDQAARARAAAAFEVQTSGLLFKDNGAPLIIWEVTNAGRTTGNTFLIQVDFGPKDSGAVNEADYLVPVDPSSCIAGKLKLVQSK